MSSPIWLGWYRHGFASQHRTTDVNCCTYPSVFPGDPNTDPHAWGAKLFTPRPAWWLLNKEVIYLSYINVPSIGLWVLFFKWLLLMIYQRWVLYTNKLPKTPGFLLSCKEVISDLFLLLHFVGPNTARNHSCHLGRPEPPPLLLFLLYRCPTHWEFPQAPNIIAPLKAGGLQSLLQAAPDGGQATDACSDDGHSPLHGCLWRGAEIISETFLCCLLLA